MSFCPSSNRPKESAIEFDTVQLGASIVPDSRDTGALATADGSLLGIETIFESLSAWMVGPVL